MKDIKVKVFSLWGHFCYKILHLRAAQKKQMWYDEGRLDKYF
jgi:hypothetical protein